MGFSTEWEELYRAGKQLSRWPWSDLIVLVYRHCDVKRPLKVLELGCGAGANIPFFKALGADYYAVEGSETMARELNEKFGGEKVHIAQGDFSKTFKFESGDYDLIVDRSAVTQNCASDIASVVERAYSNLKKGGKYIATDWFGRNHNAFKFDLNRDALDDFSFVFREGYFAGLGATHFTDEADIRAIFSKFEMEFIQEKLYRRVAPKDETLSMWDFVAVKK